MSLTRKSLRAALVSVGVVAAVAAGSGVSNAQPLTSGANGIASGNQVAVPVTAPVNVCGNAVAVVGQALAHCKGGAAVVTSHHRAVLAHARTSGHNGVLSGNQVAVPVTAPVNVCGNAVAVVGQALAHCKGGAAVVPGHRSGHQSGYTHQAVRTRAVGGGSGSGITLPIVGGLPIVGR